MDISIILKMMCAYYALNEISFYYFVKLLVNVNWSKIVKIGPIAIIYYYDVSSYFTNFLTYVDHYI